MSRTIVQINFQFTSTPTEFDALVTPLAEPIGATPGLAWKIWLMNEDSKEAGGIYLFENRETAQAYLSSQLIRDLAAHPTIVHVIVKLFEPLDKLSKITRGPLAMPQTA